MISTGASAAILPLPFTRRAAVDPAGPVSSTILIVAAGALPAQQGERRRDAIQVDVAALDMPVPRCRESRPGMQDPRVVEHDAVARAEPEGQRQLRPGEDLGECPVGSVERDRPLCRICGTVSGAGCKGCIERLLTRISRIAPRGSTEIIGRLAVSSALASVYANVTGVPVRTANAAGFSSRSSRAAAKPSSRPESPPAAAV